MYTGTQSNAKLPLSQVMNTTISTPYKNLYNMFTLYFSFFYIYAFLQSDVFVFIFLKVYTQKNPMFWAQPIVKSVLLITGYGKHKTREIW